MIRCLACSAGHPSQEFDCPACGHKPDHQDGFIAFAPGLAAAVGGFDAETYQRLARSEPGHFWFEARRRLIVQLVSVYFPAVANYLEIGCGTGGVLAAIAAARPQWRLSGSDAHTSALAIAQQEVPSSRLLQMDARAIPFIAEFDLIGAYDVIEHIADDEAVLREIHRALRPGGVIALTVPQHPFLWSEQDERAHHVRRYRRGELEHKLRAAGFALLRSTSFMAPLLPAMWLGRRQRIPPELMEARELFPPRLLNALFAALLTLERGLIRLGVSIPVGGSRLVLARRV